MKTRFFPSANPLIAAHAAVIAGASTLGHIQTSTDFAISGGGVLTLATTQPNSHTWQAAQTFTPSATGAVPFAVTGNASTSVDLARVFTSGAIGILVDKNGHLSTTTAAPAGVVGTGAGTAPSAVVATGSNQAGTLTLTTGTAPAVSATVMTLTFSGTGFTTAPKSVQFFPANAATQALAAGAQVFASAWTTTTATMTTGATGLTASTAYKWTYLVL